MPLCPGGGVPGWVGGGGRHLRAPLGGSPPGLTPTRHRNPRREDGFRRRPGAEGEAGRREGHGWECKLSRGPGSVAVCLPQAFGVSVPPGRTRTWRCLWIERLLTRFLSGNSLNSLRIRCPVGLPPKLERGAGCPPSPASAFPVSAATGSRGARRGA